MRSTPPPRSSPTTRTPRRPCYRCRPGRRRPRASSKAAAAAGGPDLAAVGGVDRVHAGPVVAEVDRVMGERDAALDRAARPVGPVEVAVVGPERVHRAALVPEEHAEAVHQRGGLATRSERMRPRDVTILHRDRHDCAVARRVGARARREQREEHELVPDVKGRRGRGQGPQSAVPEQTAGGRAESTGPTVDVLEVQRVVIDNGRELEQGAVMKPPPDAQPGTELRRVGKGAGAGQVVAVHRPGVIGGRRPRLGRGRRRRRRRRGRRRRRDMDHGLRWLACASGTHHDEDHHRDPDRKQQARHGDESPTQTGTRHGGAC